MKIAFRLVGFSLLVAVTACANSSDGDSSSGDPQTQSEIGDVADAIEGRWVLESWEERGERLMVEVGVNAVGEPWIQFTQIFEGARDSFVSGDGTGTAGTFVGSTGCNGIRETGYEFSAGFLVVEEAVVQAVGCEPNTAEQVLLAMLWNTPDGIEVVLDGDRMQWFGSNLEGIVYPLVFRRDGSPPLDPGNGSSTATPSTEDAPAVQVYESWRHRSRHSDAPRRTPRTGDAGRVRDNGDRFG